MNYTEINLEQGMPTVDEAMDLLKFQLDLCRKDKTKCLLIIHGYGSSGKGGAIGERARHYLEAQRKNGKIKNVIKGEDFSIFNFAALSMKNKYCELEPLLHVCNHGVTVVEF